MTRLDSVRRDADGRHRQRHRPVVPDRGRDRRPPPGARVRPVPRRPGARLRARVAGRARDADRRPRDAARLRRLPADARRRPAARASSTTRSACAARRSRTTTAATDTAWQYLPDGRGGRHPLPDARRPRRHQRPRRRPLLLRHPRRPRLGPLDGPVHGDGPGGRHRRGAGRRGRARPARPRRRPSCAIDFAPTARSSSSPPPRRRPPDDLRPDRPRRHRPERRSA